ncbi:MAG: sigma-70 family RNA polymerase sigma factor [Nannocystaceae bacterium]|nr:sigma-70 family RNA polymerase sigma factor [Nannocystaceae bacterium]
MTSPSQSAHADKKPDPAAGHITVLLHAWQGGDDAALEELVGVLYDKLRQLARHARRGEASNRTLDTSALVNEAYLRLAGADVDWADTRHFLAVAARAMRRVLVDDARRRSRKKRGAGGQIAVLGNASEQLVSPERPEDFLRLDEAVERLMTLDERKGRAIELFYFGGLSYGEVAKVLELSEATVHRELRAGRAWLRKELDDKVA